MRLRIHADTGDALVALRLQVDTLVRQHLTEGTTMPLSDTQQYIDIALSLVMLLSALTLIAGAIYLMVKR